MASKRTTNNSSVACLTDQSRVLSEILGLGNSSSGQAPHSEDPKKIKKKVKSKNGQTKNRPTSGAGADDVIDVVAPVPPVLGQEADVTPGVAQLGDVAGQVAGQVAREPQPDLDLEEEEPEGDLTFEEYMMAAQQQWL